MTFKLTKQTQRNAIAIFTENSKVNESQDEASSPEISTKLLRKAIDNPYSANPVTLQELGKRYGNKALERLIKGATEQNRQRRPLVVVQRHEVVPQDREEEEAETGEQMARYELSCALQRHEVEPQAQEEEETADQQIERSYNPGEIQRAKSNDGIAPGTTAPNPSGDVLENRYTSLINSAKTEDKDDLMVIARVEMLKPTFWNNVKTGVGDQLSSKVENIIMPYYTSHLNLADLTALRIQAIADLCPHTLLAEDIKKVAIVINQIIGNESTRVREDIDKYARPGETINNKSLAKNFRENYDVKIEAHSMTDDEKTAFSNALKTLPTVKKLLTAEPEEVENGQKSGEDDKEPTDWKDKGSLKENVKPVNDKKEVNKSNLADIENKADKVDKVVKILVESALLKTINRPEIRVYPRHGLRPSHPNGLRPNCASGVIRIGQDESVNTIGHEVGHHLEEHISTEFWYDLHVLMLERANQDLTTVKFAAFPTRHKIQSIGMRITAPDEGRLKGKYPATGRYTSKINADGGTEVLAMSMQYLVEPERAKKLIEKDPQQAAIILRGFIPDEYKASKELEPFNKFLPNLTDS
jgi:hypothetical protein